MEILFNERSLNKDINSQEELHEQIKSVMIARQSLLNNDKHIHCNRNLINYKLANDEIIINYIMRFEKTDKIDVLTWLTKTGPFWDDGQLHLSEDSYFYLSENVSGSSLAEAAACLYCDEERHTFSLKSGEYNDEFINVTWKSDDTIIEFSIENHTSVETLIHKIRPSIKDIESWNQLEKLARSEFENLEFTKECFLPLNKLPFYKAASTSIMAKLDVLNTLKSSFEISGEFNPQGQELYQQHFTGDKAWFSDSSESERRDFKTEMSFKINEKETRSCTWHGKVKTPQIRIHFSDPIENEKPLYVAYIGEKITKR